jgi:hypothetical protein
MVMIDNEVERSILNQNMPYYEQSILIQEKQELDFEILKL